MEDTSLDQFLDDTEDSSGDESPDAELASDREESDCGTPESETAKEDSGVQENQEPSQDSNSSEDIDRDSIDSMVDPSTVEPTEVTSRWTGVDDNLNTDDACEECTTATGRLWQEDGRFLCADCKSWE